MGDSLPWILDSSIKRPVKEASKWLQWEQSHEMEIEAPRLQLKTSMHFEERRMLLDGTSDEQFKYPLNQILRN